MKSLVFAGGLAFLIADGPAMAAGKFEISSSVAKEINVTSDSRPGWIPTADQRQLALSTVQAFLDAIENGRYAEAYELQSEGIQQTQSLARFTKEAQEFRALAGPVVAWRVLKVTWTKDSARAPFPGTYAAVDLTAQFANVDRYCGYMVVYQAPSGGDFSIMRREGNFLSNATARQIEEKQSKAEVDRLWGQLSRNCPNYVPSAGGQ